MKKYRVFLLIIISFTSVLITYFIAVSVTEKYFFDKLYYRKSNKFGYYSLSDFNGKEFLATRMNGIYLLSKFKSLDNDVLGVQMDPNVYNIAVIGDSYVWGQGIKNEDRFVNVLESKLNKIRSTKLYNLGRPGDNFLDNLSKYNSLSQNFKPNLYIFILVANDILLNKVNDYESQSENQIVEMCKSMGKLQYDYVEKKWSKYSEYINRAWENEANLCILNAGVEKLPHNAIYLVVDNYHGLNSYNTYLKILKDNGFDTYSINVNSEGIDDYRKYLKNDLKVFYVSEKEGHPSALANRMYADFLFYKITKYQKWGFR
jgi:hypothetical protein